MSLAVPQGRTPFPDQQALAGALARAYQWLSDRVGPGPEAPVTASLEPVTSRLAGATDAIAGLQNEVTNLVEVPEGPHGVFHHLSYVVERLRDTRAILLRLGSQRLQLTNAYAHGYGGGLPDQPVITGKRARWLARADELNGLMKLDLESLYIFANLALDQWAYSIAYLTGLSDPEKKSFVAFTYALQSKAYSGPLSEFKARHFPDLIWLFYQIRNYRNIFVEHVTRPWQRGRTASLFGEDFNLFIPIPPGWLQGTDIGARIRDEILPLAPEWLRRLPDNSLEKQRPGLILERTFEQIDEIADQAERQKVWDLWKEVGGSTVSFHRLAERFTKFMSETPGTILEAIRKDPSIINLGSP